MALVIQLAGSGPGDQQISPFIMLQTHYGKSGNFHSPENHTHVLVCQEDFHSL